ncbi:MAG: hypothetical protein IIA30_13930 [Myxococcales bacterium]|nr:hypothetical protein [Myxococcales bacterium]
MGVRPGRPGEVNAARTDRPGVPRQRQLTGLGSSFGTRTPAAGCVRRRVAARSGCERCHRGGLFEASETLLESRHSSGHDRIGTRLLLTHLERHQSIEKRAHVPGRSVERRTAHGHRGSRKRSQRVPRGQLRLQGIQPSLQRGCDPRLDHADVAAGVLDSPLELVRAVIGVADDLKGQVPLGFLVLKSGVDREPGEITSEAVALVRTKIGPVAAFKTAIVVKRVPKTRSGKILRATMQKIADCEDYKIPATIEDPAILDEIAEALTGIGYAGG